MADDTMTTQGATTTGDDLAPAAAPETISELVTEDVLVEEVSIDGMCGVY